MIRRIVSISLSAIGLVFLLLNAIPPIFSFWNYRLSMIIMLPVCLFVFLVALGKRKTKLDIICGCLSLLFSAILAIMSGGYWVSGIICATIGFLIGFMMLTQGKFRPLMRMGGAIAVPSVVLVVAVFAQLSELSRYLTAYEKATSGNYNVPASAAEPLYVAAYNELGMLFAVICLVLALFAICMKNTYSTKEVLREEVENTEAPVLQDVEIDTTVVFCRKCGTKLKNDSCYCVKCGEKVEIE